jgi:hypothetical protein
MGARRLAAKTTLLLVFIPFLSSFSLLMGGRQGGSEDRQSDDGRIGAIGERPMRLPNLRTVGRQWGRRRIYGADLP